jgi:MoxR-like ATPase
MENAFTDSQNKAIEKINLIRTELKSQFIQRDAEVDGLCIALLANTNIMLFGPPGTAKSLLTRTFANALAVPKEQYFENLCHAYTVPEELFGPLNLQKLENSIYERKIDGYLPTARVAYLDELMNMNQTQLNPLNTILQEKEFLTSTRKVTLLLKPCMTVSCCGSGPTTSTLAARCLAFLSKKKSRHARHG